MIPKDIENAFEEYYEGATIETPTDLNQVYDLKSKMDVIDVYRWPEVEQSAQVFFDKQKKQSALHRILDQAIRGFGERDIEKQKQFGAYIRQFIASYEFIS